MYCHLELSSQSEKEKEAEEKNTTQKGEGGGEKAGGSIWPVFSVQVDVSTNGSNIKVSRKTYNINYLGI